MKYKNIKNDNKIVGYNTRIQQLEEEHFSNVIYMEEAEILGDDAAIQHFSQLNKSIEARIEGLTAKLSELEKDDSEDNTEDGSTK